MIDQKRHGTGETSYEIPAGCAEPTDPSMLDAARRELAEETGYGGGKWRLTVLAPSPATQNNRTHRFVAEEVKPHGACRPAPTEDIRVHLLTHDEVLELLRSDRIRQALMAAPLRRYLYKGKETE